MKPLLLLSFVVTFIGGLMGADPSTAFVIAVGAFIPACGRGGAWWVWFVLSVCGWAAGGATVALLGLLDPANFSDLSGHFEPLGAVVAAASSAIAGTSLHWAASRMTRQG